ncbi:peptidase M24, structural domain-containing protein [Naematelia encephala]|uniref:Peptidase M24, structural domain-containing protein n=1 Tax=Naematelia encephala TaxID=71784 RepID=A0A1Y2BLM3_9TREE|nr:peptidase M24, structural domain-containing protein [Naematelia encephala]
MGIRLRQNHTLSSNSFIYHQSSRSVYRMNGLVMMDNKVPAEDQRFPLAQGKETNTRRRAIPRHILYIVLTSFLVAYTFLPSITSRQLVSIFRPHTNVPPLDPGFLSSCHALLAPTASTFTSRLARLSDALSSADSSVTSSRAIYVAEPGPSAEYFLGAFSSSDWWLSERPFLVAFIPDSKKEHGLEVILLTPEFEELRAKGTPIPDQVQEHVRWLSWKESESPYEVLISDLTASGGVDAVLVEDEVRNFIAVGLRNAASAIGAKMTQGIESKELQDVQEAIWAIRETKDEREIGLLRCANQLTLHSIRKTRERMYIGITESETRIILHEQMEALGLVGGEGLILFGENAALPHGSGTDRALGKEDFVLIDAGGRWGGYIADITRTFALPESKIPTAHLEIWETVRQAQYAPYEFLKSTNTSQPPLLASLDIAARGVISKRMAVSDTSPSPSPDFSVFTHRLGHGIGLQVHEAPYLVQGPLGHKILRKGNVFSLEPGVYIPRGSEEARKRGSNGVGARLEDCFAVTVTEDGQFDGIWLSGPVTKWGEI